MQYELKTMSVGEILDMSYRLVRDNFWLIFTLTGVVYFPVYLLQSLARPQTGQGDPTSPLGIVGSLALIGFSLLLVLFFGPIANAAVTKAVADRYLDRPASFGDAYGLVFHRLGKLLGAIVLSSLLIVGGGLLLLIPGLLFALRYTLVPAVVILEDTGGAAALKRSRELMKGNWLKVVCLWVLMAVLSSTLTVTAALIPQEFIAAFVSTALYVLYLSFAQVAYVVLYMHARCQKEAFDLEFLAKSLTESSGSPSGPATGNP